MRADLARADRPSRDLGPERVYRARSTARLRPARPNPWLRRQTGMVGLGRRQRSYAAKRATRSDRRAALADTGGGQFRSSLRPYAGNDRAPHGESAGYADGRSRSVAADRLRSRKRDLAPARRIPTSGP